MIADRNGLQVIGFQIEARRQNNTIRCIILVVSGSLTPENWDGSRSRRESRYLMRNWWSPLWWTMQTSNWQKQAELERKLIRNVHYHSQINFNQFCESNIKPKMFCFSYEFKLVDGFLISSDLPGPPSRDNTDNPLAGVLVCPVSHF